MTEDRQSDEVRLEMLRLRGELQRQALKKAAADLGQRAHELRGLGVLSRLAGVAASAASFAGGTSQSGGRSALDILALLRTALSRAEWLPLAIGLLRAGRLPKRWRWAAVGVGVVATVTTAMALRNGRRAAKTPSTANGPTTSAGGRPAQ